MVVNKLATTSWVLRLNTVKTCIQERPLSGFRLIGFLSIRCILGVIVSITKFLIVIGSPRAWLSHNGARLRGCPLEVFDLNFL